MREIDTTLSLCCAILAPMAPFRTLKVWQHAQRLAVECARAAKRFPDADQKVLAEQLLRASSSVPLNIAEGSARKGSKERIARRSRKRSRACEGSGVHRCYRLRPLGCDS